MNPGLEQAISKHRQGDVEGARRTAEAALNGSVADSSLLHFLGMLEAGAGRFDRARVRLEQANVAAPESLPIVVSLARVLFRSAAWQELAALPQAGVGALGGELAELRARALSELNRWEEAGVAWEAAATERPEHIAARNAAARAFVQAGTLDKAEANYRAALAREPGSGEALLGLAGVLESLSRPQELAPLAAAAAKAGAPRQALTFAEAIRLREAGEWQAGLAALEMVDGAVPEGTLQQMRGEMLDRMDEPGAAFLAFQAMNKTDAAAEPLLLAEAEAYRAELQREAARLVPSAAVASGSGRSAPLFLVGFPRSGTTLLDTFLMGHPDVEVHEERPFLDEAFRSAVPGRQSSGFNAGALSNVREAYWRALDHEVANSDALQVDKNPLASAGAHLIHRIFPDARFIFALRHPYDVVLSCFITRFRLNRAMASLLDLGTAAELYDAVMRLWVRARKIHRLQVHEVRYEQLVREPEAVLRETTAFAGLPFDKAMLDHRLTARRRGLISTASHAQVASPLTTRPSGRWHRYRKELEPVLPILEPWCRRFGYAVE